MTQHDQRRPRRVLHRRLALATAVAATVLPAGAAAAAYSALGTVSSTATVPEAVELSGLVASPTHPGWYWTHSDVPKASDAPAACAGLTGAALGECQEVQRARLWALRFDPDTHKVVEARAFSLSDPAWALDPVLAQNNDWEDIAVAPARASGRPGLLIGATGHADRKPVLDAEGRDITCNTRRLIELEEPDLSDPAATTWTPTVVFDLANPVGTGGVKTCNFESLTVGDDGAGRPTAYLVSRTQRKLFARSLSTESGRAATAPAAAAGSGEPHQPQLAYVGAVRGAVGMHLTAADSNGRSVALLARKTATAPCRVLTWPLTAAGVGVTLTGTDPVVSPVPCNNLAEGLAYAHDAADARTATDDLVAVSDTGGSSKFTTWYFSTS